MGGSGGGSSGSVSYPEGMESVLYDWLFGYPNWSGHSSHDTLSNSITDELNRLYSSSPYSGVTAFDPDTAISNFSTEVGAFTTLVNALSYSSDYAAIIAVALAQISLDTATLYTTTLDSPVLDTATLDSITIDESRVSDDIDAFDDLLTAQITDIDLPKFQAGMLDIGAVNTSAFVLGQALLLAYKNREVAKYGTGLRVELYKLYDDLNSKFKLQRREIDAQHQQNYRRLKAEQETKYREITADLQKKYGDQTMAFKTERAKLVQTACSAMISMLIRKVELKSNSGTLTGEVSKFTALAKKEELTEQMSFDESDERWYIESFQFGANVLGAIGGGTAMNPVKKPSAAVSALSGAIGGAAAGASVGGPYAGYAAAGGAVLGGVLGYFGSQ